MRGTSGRESVDWWGVLPAGLHLLRFAINKGGRVYSTFIDAFHRVIEGGLVGGNLARVCPIENLERRVFNVGDHFMDSIITPFVPSGGETNDSAGVHDEVGRVDDSSRGKKSGIVLWIGEGVVRRPADDGAIQGAYGFRIENAAERTRRKDVAFG